jgi:hypothetical protein
VRALITGEPEVSGLLFDDLLPEDSVLEDVLIDEDELESGAV